MKNKIKKTLHIITHMFNVNQGVTYSWWDTNDGYLRQGFQCSCGNIYNVTKNSTIQREDILRYTEGAKK